jgi:hypothetical protein
VGATIPVPFPSADGGKAACTESGRIGASNPRKPVPLERLEAQICELAGHLAAATCRFLVLLGDFDDRRGWASWDMTSCAAWLSWKCQMSSGTGPRACPGGPGADLDYAIYTCFANAEYQARQRGEQEQQAGHGAGSASTPETAPRRPVTTEVDVIAAIRKLCQDHALS